MTDNKSVRDPELLKKLRAKTSSKNRAGKQHRNQTPVTQAQNKSLDIASLMMSMGIDDPELLTELQGTNNPKVVMQKLQNLLSKAKAEEEPKVSEPSVVKQESSDEEDVPDLV